MSTKPESRPEVPYQALAAAFVTWATANRAVAAAMRAEEEAQKAFDGLARAHATPQRKLVLDLDTAAPPDSDLAGKYVIVSLSPVASGPATVVAEPVRK